MTVSLPPRDLCPGRDHQLGKPVCAAGQPASLQVSRSLMLFTSDRLPGVDRPIEARHVRGCSTSDTSAPFSALDLMPLSILLAIGGSPKVSASKPKISWGAGVRVQRGFDLLADSACRYVASRARSCRRERRSRRLLQWRSATPHGRRNPGAGLGGRRRPGQSVWLVCWEAARCQISARCLMDLG